MPAIFYWVGHNIHVLTWGSHNVVVSSKEGKESPKAFKVEGRSFLTIARSESEFETDARSTQEVHVMIVKAALITDGEEKPVVEGPNSCNQC